MKATIRARFHAVVGLFKCAAGHHDFETVQILTGHSWRVCCRRCRKSFAVNSDLCVAVPWTPSFHKMYEFRGIKIVYKDWEFSKPNASLTLSGDAAGRKESDETE
jgi:hypothetical protein